MSYRFFAIVALGVAAGAMAEARPTSPASARPPARVGMCSFKRIRRVEQRLEDAAHVPVANTGSAVLLDNTVYGVSYDEVAAVNESRPGDRVLTCLVKTPRNCPPGDKRGKLYTTTNLRTDQSWTLPDAEHQCGGA